METIGQKAQRMMAPKKCCIIVLKNGEVMSDEITKASPGLYSMDSGDITLASGAVVPIDDIHNIFDCKASLEEQIQNIITVRKGGVSGDTIKKLLGGKFTIQEIETSLKALKKKEAIIEARAKRV